MRMRFRFGLAAVALALGVGSACLSPTLPLPPPEEPDTIFQGDNGEWTIIGTCVDGAEVVAINERTGRGEVFLDLAEDGVYAVHIVGQECDVVSITQSLGTEPENRTRTLLRNVQDGIEENPDACR